MKPFNAHSLILALVLAAASPLATADRGGNHGHGHGHDDDRGNRHEERHGRGDDRDGGMSVSIRFGDTHRYEVANYFGAQSAGGNCPPGLAKKHNGCMPPGQARKWQMGRPLPRDVVYYPLPGPLLARLPPPPAGYNYVRVASDVLMIAVGTSMVVDAMNDIVR